MKPSFKNCQKIGLHFFSQLLHDLNTFGVLNHMRALESFQKFILNINSFDQLNCVYFCCFCLAFYIEMYKIAFINRNSMINNDIYWHEHLKQMDNNIFYAKNLRMIPISNQNIKFYRNRNISGVLKTGI